MLSCVAFCLCVHPMDHSSRSHRITDTRLRRPMQMTSPAAFTTIRVTVEDGLGIIKFSRPDKFNSFIAEQ